MRAAAVALVLIIGAAVVLSFANTLNSWVLGGLIGGLAALLISIPISLLLFSHLSRRHDEQLKAELEEEMALAQSLEYEEPAEQVYDAEGYLMSEEYYIEQREQVEYPEERGYRLPAPHRLPAAGQSQAAMDRAFQQRATIYSPVDEQYLQDGSVARRKNPTPHRLPAAQTPGNYGSPDARRSRHHTAALRAAMREAARQKDDPDVDVFPTTPGNLRRSTSTRLSQPLEEQPARSSGQRPSRQLPQSPRQTTSQNRSQRIVDATPPQSSSRRSSQTDNGSSTSQSLQRGPAQFRNPRQFSEPQTDQLRERYPETGPVRPQTRTGQLARHPRIEEQLRNPERITGSLKNPLVRRAPYLYEDDPLREQLAQQIEGPVRRRSSRLEPSQYEQYEDYEVEE